MRMRILSECSESKDLSSHPIRESVLRSINTLRKSSKALHSEGGMTLLTPVSSTPLNWNGTCYEQTGKIAGVP